MIGTHYNRPPDMDKVQTLLSLLGEPRYRNSLGEIVPFEATVIRQVKAVGSSGWPWIEEDYAKILVIFDRAGWDKDINKYQAAHLPFPLPKTDLEQKRIQREQKVDVSGLTSYFSQQYLQRAFLPTMDGLFAAVGVSPIPIWPEESYRGGEDVSVAIAELSLKFNVGVGCAVVSYRPPYLMVTNIKIEELQEERGHHQYSKEDLAEALAQHFQSAIALPPLWEDKPPVIHTDYCPGSGVRGQ